MPRTTNLVSRAACLTSAPLVDSLHSVTWGQVEVSQLTLSREGQDSMRRPLVPGTRNEAQIRRPGPSGSPSTGGRGPEVEAA